jgi:hypothetical protein
MRWYQALVALSVLIVAAACDDPAAPSDAVRTFCVAGPLTGPSVARFAVNSRYGTAYFN